MKKKMLFTLLIVLMLSILYLNSAPYTSFVNSIISKNKTIVIDAGHGGYDPGKVGVSGTLEKDINLSIALKLKKCLEEKDYNVIMTREDDRHLYTEGCQSKKTDDLNNRIKIIDEANPLLVVSIHQNSFQDSTVSGAQVFYYGDTSTESDSKTIAETLQYHLINTLDPNNHRVAKANTSYYLLKNTPHPIVIIECGFLSNPSEEALLITDEYQNKCAMAICEGIESYANSH